MKKDLPIFNREGASYLPLAAFQFLPRNPRFHDDPGILKAIARFGMIDTPTVNLTTGHTLAGQGRVTALRLMLHKGDAPPAGIIIEDGAWAVPVHTVELPEAMEEAAALALNKLVERGGYDEVKLLALLRDIQAQGETLLDASGFRADEVEYLAAQLRNAPPSPDAQEKAIETHKQFVVGPYRWKVEIEAYSSWAASIREEAKEQYLENGGDPDAAAPDLKPYFAAILSERLGFGDDPTDSSYAVR